MREVIANEHVVIPVGRQGENGAVQVLFPIADYAALYGAGAFELLNQRPTENTPYTCSITVDDDYVRWTVQAADVAIVGHGRCELTYVVNSSVAKSTVFSTCVLRSIEGSGTVPEPYESRIAELIERSANITVDANRAEAAEEGAAAQALKSEGYAVGQQDGSDVGEGSPYYHNSAKYYKEQADEDAQQASGKADTARAQALKAEGYAVGKQNGADVGDESPYYHNNAEYFKEQAAGSAESASGSAEEATRQAGLASDDREAIENMTVSSQTLEPGASVEVTKTVNPQTGRVNLDFAIPQGDDYHLTSEDKQNIAELVEEDTDIFQETTGLSIKEFVATICGYVRTIAAFVEYTGDTALSDSSEMWVQNKVVTAAITAINLALAGKQDTLTFDNAPTQGSNNPVKSGGVYSALSQKQDTLTFDDSPTQGSNNPVKSGGVYTSVKTLDDNIKAGTEETSEYHLGFYLDGDGNVCQTEE